VGVEAAPKAMERLAFSFSFHRLSQKTKKPTPANMSNPIVFFDITANDAPLGRIEMTVRE
jgi:hypothetical protein